MALPFGVRQKPALVEMPAQKMAVVRSLGDPSAVAEQVFPLSTAPSSRSSSRCSSRAAWSSR